MAGLVNHKKSKNLWFRMVVPPRHRVTIGRTEIKFSLKTSDPAEAKVAYAAAQVEWRQRFLTLDRECEVDSVQQAPGLVADALRKLSAGARLDDVVLAMMKFMSFRMATSWGAGFFATSDAAMAFGGVPDDDTWVGETPEVDVVPAVDRVAFIGRIRSLERSAQTQGMGHREAVVRLLESRRWNLVEAEVLLVESATEATIPAGGPLYNAVAEALLVALVNHRFEAWDETALAAFPLVASPAPLVDGDAAIASPVRTQTSSPIADQDDRSRAALSAALVHWRKMQQPQRQSDLEVTRAVDRFVAMFGDMALGDITSRHILDYRDLIMLMPRNLQLTKIAAAGQTLREVIQTNANTPNGTRLSRASIKKDVGGLRAVLGVVADEKWISVNVAAGVRTGKRLKGTGITREPFTPAMMAALFASPMFTGCAGPSLAARTRAGQHVYQDIYYWAPLLSALSGARIEEIGQALTRDVETINLVRLPRRWPARTFTIMRITDAGVDQHVKNEGSRRVLIIHPKLIELGFLDYVEPSRAAGSERLFDLTYSSNEKWTKELSRQLNRYIDATVTKDPLYVFHSLRHEFRDRADDSDIDPKITRKVMGHVPGDVSDRYGKGASIRKVAAEMAKLDTSFIDWLRLIKAASRS